MVKRSVRRENFLMCDFLFGKTITSLQSSIHQSEAVIDDDDDDDDDDDNSNIETKMNYLGIFVFVLLVQ